MSTVSSQQKAFFRARAPDRFLEISDLSGAAPAAMWRTLCAFVEAWSACPTTRPVPAATALATKRDRAPCSETTPREEEESLPEGDAATPTPPKEYRRPALTEVELAVVKKAVPMPRHPPTWHEACRPLHPRGVLYNRMPKSGSASVMSWMAKELNATARYRHGLDKTNVTWWTPHVAKHRWLATPRDEAAFARQIRGFGAMGPFVAQRHVYHTPSLIETDDVVFVNVARDPIERCLSRYNYEAFYKKRIPPVDFDECIMRDPRCDLNAWTLKEGERRSYGAYPLPKKGATAKERREFLKLASNDSIALLLDECHDYATRWFCGHAFECRDPKRPDLALKIAKRHILMHYAHVGVLEDLPNTVQLFRLRLPDFFAGDPTHTPDEADFPELHSAKTLVARVVSAKKKKSSSTTATNNVKTKSAPLSVATMERLIDANRRDIDLYHFILDLHRRRVSLCLKTSGDSTSSSSRSSSTTTTRWHPEI